MAYISQPVLTCHDRRRSVQRLGQGVSHVPHAAWRPGADIESPRTGNMFLTGEHGRGSDIAHMDEVATLGTILEDRWRPVVAERRGEYRGNTCIRRVAWHSGP